MRRLLRNIGWLLALGALTVAFVVGVSDNKAAFGKVQLPEGGQVHLLAGEVNVFYLEPGGIDSEATNLPAPVRFVVTPAAGGPRLVVTNAAGGAQDVFTERRLVVGTPGTIAEVDVPAEGEYQVTGNAGRSQIGAALTFGDSPLQAIARKTSLIGGLLAGALLLGVITSLMPLSARHQAEERPYDVHPEAAASAPSQEHYSG